MEKFTSLLKQVRPVDIIIIVGVIIALIVGYFTFTNVRQTADKQIEATSKIRFDVFVRGVTLTGEGLPMKKNEKTFISIRNVPYSELDIIDVKSDRKKTVLPTFNSKKVIVVEDVSQANLYDIVITLEDMAKITKDGAVVGGNKIKMGLPITLEGEDYRFNGIVSDLKLVPDTHEAVNNHDTTYDVQ
ncbi:MAG: DUF4330 domain-containing protein [Cyanobacteria bacterium SIG32]|nr:DUF4330 domain-containing protein [Cyanobacteria bacterium SIG32]